MTLQETSITHSALGWVKKSIDDNLSEIKVDLKRYIDEQDESLLEGVRERLGVIQGVLVMIEQYGAAMLTEEMVALANFISSEPGKGESALEVLLRAVLQLPDYLEHIQSGHRDIPIAILPLLNDIRAVRNQDLFSEKLLFLPDLSVHQEDAESDAIDNDSNQASKLLAKKLRPVYQLALVNVIKEQALEESLKRLEKVCETLEERSISEQVARIWWIVGALIESVSRQQLELGVSIKNLLGKVDALFRVILIIGERGLMQRQPVELIKNFLFYIAQPECDGPKSQAIKIAYRLEQFLPSESTRSEVLDNIAGPNQALLKTVAEAMKADIEEIKSTLEVYVNGDLSQVEALKELPHEMHIVSDTLAMIGLGPQRQLMEGQIVTVKEIVAGTQAADEEQLLSMAAELLQIEQALEQMQKRQPISDEAPRSETEVSRDYELDGVLMAVVSAALDNIQNTKTAILEFIRDTSRTENIELCIALMAESRGALELLEQQRAVTVVDGLLAYLRGYDVSDFNEASRMDALSQVVVSLEYYLEAFGEHRSDVNSILDIADEQLQELLSGLTPRSDGGVDQEPVVAAIEADMTVASTETGVVETDAKPEPTAAPESEPLAAVNVTTDREDAEDEIGGLPEEGAQVVGDLSGELEQSQALSGGSPDQQQTVAEEPAPVEADAIPEPTAAVRMEVTPVEEELEVLKAGSDEDILEIYLEEAEEEARNIARQQQDWLLHPEDENALKNIRRAFHTIKGSGRLVGAIKIGEFAWDYEQLLNRVIDKSIPPSKQTIEAVGLSTVALKELIDELQTGTPPKVDIPYLRGLARSLSEFKAEQLLIDHSGTIPAVESPYDRITDSDETGPETGIGSDTQTIPPGARSARVLEGIEPDTLQISPPLESSLEPEEDVSIAALDDSKFSDTLVSQPPEIPVAQSADSEDVAEAIKPDTTQTKEDYTQAIDYAQASSLEIAGEAGEIEALEDEPTDKEAIFIQTVGEDFLGTVSDDFAEEIELRSPEPAETGIETPATDEPDFDAASVADDPGVEESIDLEPLEPEVGAESIDLEPLEPEVAAESIDLEPLEPEVAAESIDLEPLEPEVAAEAIDLEPLEVEVAAEPEVEEIVMEAPPVGIEAGVSAQEDAPIEEIEIDLKPEPPESESASSMAAEAEQENPPDPFVATTGNLVPGKGAGDSVPGDHEPQEPTGLSFDPELLTIYQQEVEQHLSIVSSALDRAEQIGELVPSEEIYRALHTIHGASRTADIATIGELAGLLEKPLKSAISQKMALDHEIIALYRSGQQALASMTEELVATRQLPVIPRDLEISLKALAEDFEEHTVELPEGEEEPTGEFVDTLTMMNESADGQQDMELLTIFVDEANELLEMSDNTLHAWSHQNSDEPAVQDYSSVMELQRYLHTLKGGARMAELKQISDLAHEMESMFIAVIDGRVDKNDNVIELLEDCFDLLHQQVVEAQEGRDMGDPESLIEQLKNIRRGDDIDFGESTLDDISSIDVDSEEIDIVSENLPGEPLAGIERPTQDVIKVRSDLLDNLVSSAGEVSIYRARMEQQVAGLGSHLGELGQTIARLKGQLRNLEAETDAQIHYSHRDEGGHLGDFDPLEMDRYTMIQELSRSLGESVNDLSSLQAMLGEQVKDSETLLLQQSRVNTDLQDGLIKSRMVKFSGLLSRLRRLVRQSSQELGKKAELFVTGEENEVDNKVLDRMVAPLEHIIRNALSHGIETPVERVKKGKAESGRIAIDISRDGSDIVIQVKDDGAGVNLEKIRSRAVQLGLLDQKHDVSDSDLVQFILEPGFSTADHVTQLSGRGVGMDVVDIEIKQLGGTLQIDTTPQGTTFTARLPFTLSINQAILVRTGEETYAIPLINIEGITRLDAKQMLEYYRRENAELEYAGQQFTLHNLAELVDSGGQFRPGSDDDKEAVILSRAGEVRIALHVDEIIGNREIVVKSLGKQLSQVKGLAGASILADGSVVLILDINGLMRHSADSAVKIVYHEEDEQAPKTRDTVMVVDDSITMRRVASKLLERHNYEVVTAKDGVDALSQLQDSNPDVMLLDIEMPRMDGFELAIHMQNEESFSKIPIIMITSRTGEKHRDRALEIGVANYMGKPYQEDELIENIQNALGSR